jgi:RNA exonuclease 4
MMVPSNLVKMTDNTNKHFALTHTPITAPMPRSAFLLQVDSTPRDLTTGKRRRRPPAAASSGSASDSSSVSSGSANGGSPSSKTTSSKTSSSSSKPSRRERKRLNAAKRSHVAVDDLSDEQKARYVALDCEMVGVGHNGSQSALARVTLIDWNADILLDCFVRPEQPVVDYRTFVSGITSQDLESEYAISMDECQWMVADMLYNKILVGHALKNDLHALGISHPWYDTRDTAKYEPFMKLRFDNGILWPRKLKDLTKEKLGRDIQLPGQPHSAFEDALGALDLYKKNRVKWEKAMDYKLMKTRQIQTSSSQLPLPSSQLPFLLQQQEDEPEAVAQQ